MEERRKEMIGEIGREGRREGIIKEKETVSSPG